MNVYHKYKTPATSASVLYDIKLPKFNIVVYISAVKPAVSVGGY